MFFLTSGPLSWAVPAELFGTAMRLKGVSWGAMTSFAFNTMIGQVTPIAISSIGWVSYLLLRYMPMTDSAHQEILPRVHRMQPHKRCVLLVFPA